MYNAELSSTCILFVCTGVCVICDNVIIRVLRYCFFLSILCFLMNYKVGQWLRLQREGAGNLVISKIIVTTLCSFFVPSWWVLVSLTYISHLLSFIHIFSITNTNISYSSKEGHGLTNKYAFYIFVSHSYFFLFFLLNCSKNL